MAVDVVFSDAKKGYNKDEVQRFIKQLSDEHEMALRAKDDAIKTMMNERETADKKYAEELQALQAELEKVRAEAKEQGAKYDELCARMGEKLLFAERQSATVIADAEARRASIEKEAEKTARTAVAEISAKAREDAAAALRAADILKQKSQLISAGLDHTKRVLEEAIASIEKAAGNA